MRTQYPVIILLYIIIVLLTGLLFWFKHTLAIEDEFSLRLASAIREQKNANMVLEQQLLTAQSFQVLSREAEKQGFIFPQ